METTFYILLGPIFYAPGIYPLVYPLGARSLHFSHLNAIHGVADTPREDSDSLAPMF